MYQATTPTHTFNLPFDALSITKLILTYQQNHRTVITKTEQDVALIGKTLSVTLTQEETKRFSKIPAFVQLRCRVGDKVMASQILKINVHESLNREAI